jgi:hypothetical protein
MYASAGVVLMCALHYYTLSGVIVHLDQVGYKVGVHVFRDCSATRFSCTVVLWMFCCQCMLLRFVLSGVNVH